MAFSSLSEPLTEVPTKSAWGRRSMAIVAGLVLSAGIGGYMVGKASSAEVPANASGFLANTTSFYTGLWQHKPSCYGFTGGTCATTACKEFRHAECGDNFHCVCANAGCTDVNGACGAEPYKKVADKISFSNAYWSSEWLYMPSVTLLSQMKVSGGLAGTFAGSQLFTIFEVPGRLNNKKMYFVASDKFPSWVATIHTTGGVLSASASAFGMYGANLLNTLSPWDPQNVVLHICQVRDTDEVMIGSSGADGRPIWAYVHRLSSFVYGWFWTSDPGSGGYWVPSTPIEGIEKC